MEKSRALQGSYDLALLRQPQPLFPACRLDTGLQHPPSRHQHVNVLRLVREMERSILVQAGNSSPKKLDHLGVSDCSWVCPTPTATAAAGQLVRRPRCRDDAERDFPQGRVVSHVPGELEAKVFLGREAFFFRRQVGQQGISKLEVRVLGERRRNAAAVSDGLRVCGAAVAP